MFRAFDWISVWVASTCSTSEVPMPCARAPKAPCVEVWLSPHTMVVPGSVKPCSGPMMWTMPWRAVELVEIFDAELSHVLGQRLDLEPRLGLLDAAVRRSVVWMLWSTTASVRPGERTLPPRHAQALEGLRARHLVDEVAVDVEEAGAVGLTVDDVVVPDLVVEGAGSGAAAFSSIVPFPSAPVRPSGPRSGLAFEAAHARLGRRWA